MTPDDCRTPISLADLAEYWLGEMSDPRQAEIEQHVFECGACSRTLEQLVAMTEGLRGLAGKGAVATVLTPAFLTRLKERGARIREYRLDPGDSVNCSIAPDEDLAVAHVRAALEGVTRLDVVFENVAGGLAYRFTDVLFNPDEGEIVLAPRAADLRQLYSVTQWIRLVSVTESGDQVLGEYLFKHTPYPVSE